MIGTVEEDEIIDGDDTVKNGDYFIFSSNKNKNKDDPMLVHRLTTTEYITYKLKDKRKKIYKVINLSPTFKFKQIYE